MKSTYHYHIIFSIFVVSSLPGQVSVWAPERGRAACRASLTVVFHVMDASGASMSCPNSERRRKLRPRRDGQLLPYLDRTSRHSSKASRSMSRAHPRQLGNKQPRAWHRVCRKPARRLRLASTALKLRSAASLQTTLHKRVHLSFPIGRLPPETGTVAGSPTAPQPPPPARPFTSPTTVLFSR